MYQKLIQALVENNFRYLETYDMLGKEWIICVEAEDGKALVYTFDRKTNFIRMNLNYSGFDPFLDSIATCTLLTGQFQYISLHEGERRFPIHKEEED